MKFCVSPRKTCIQNRSATNAGRRNTILQVSRTAKTALKAFDDILAKPKPDRNDFRLFMQKIRMFEDHVDALWKPTPTARRRYCLRSEPSETRALPNFIPAYSKAE